MVGGPQLLNMGMYVEAKDTESLQRSSKWDMGYLLPCLLLHEQCSTCMEKGNFVFPSSLPSNQMLLFCFSFCFDEDVLILVPNIWKWVCCVCTGVMMVPLVWAGDFWGMLLVHWAGKPWQTQSSFQLGWSKESLLVIWEASNPLFSPKKRFCLLVTKVDLVRGECTS